MSAGWLLSRPAPAAHAHAHAQQAAAAAAAALPGRENWRLGHVWAASWSPDAVGAAAVAPCAAAVGHRALHAHATVYHERQPEADSLNSSPAPGAAPKGPLQGQGHGQGLFGSLLGSLSSRGSMAASAPCTLDRPHPYDRLWGALAALYGKLLLVLTLALCLAEVLDNNIRLLSLQGIFLMYLYVGSIAVIICIYVWLLVDSCAQLGAGRDAELEMGLGGRFDSLRRAHLPRPGPQGSAFYLRVGALAFGLGTLVFNGLEMAMHAMMEGDCLNDVVFVHPVLHGLFTFLQMHFLFVNSQVLVHRFGAAARLGFMHLAATNVALWLRLVLWESAVEWTYLVALARGWAGAAGAGPPGPLELRGFPRALALPHGPAPAPASGNASAAAHALDAPAWAPGTGPSRAHVDQVVALHRCLNTNALGQLWTASMPFLYPFIVQFSLIAAAVAFSMGQQVGRGDALPSRPRKKCGGGGGGGGAQRAPVDCAGASKGLFPGLLALAAAAVVVVIFLVVRDRDLAFPAAWLTDGCAAGALLLAAAAAAAAAWRVRRLPLVRRPGAGGATPHRLLGAAAHVGLLLHGVFGALVGAAGLVEGADDALRGRHALLLAVSLLQVAQAAAQAGLLAEARARGCVTRAQLAQRPGRQALTCLLGANAALWALDTFVAQSWAAQELQLRFFGVLVWGVISRIALPLVAFYRFHGCVLLLDVWRRAYRPPSCGADAAAVPPPLGAGN